MNDVLIGIAKPDTKGLSELSNLSDIHLKLQEIDGALVMHSVKPPLQVCHLDYDYKHGYPKIKLRHIV